MENEQRQWDAFESAVPAFIGLSRLEAEELAHGLGLHACALDWDALKEPVALGFSTDDNIIFLHLRGGVVSRAEPG